MTKEVILDYFKDINHMYNDCTRYDTLKRMLDELQEPCEDCISRADAIEFFKDDDYVVNELKNLAPVTPAEKVGKWIYMDDDNLPNRNCQIMNSYRFECSKCRRNVIVPNWESVLFMFPYCNCGCKMVDIEKDNTRYDEFGFIDPFSFREDGEQEVEE